MRIFSKFRDFDDSIAGAAGFDKSVIYNRKTKIEQFSEFKPKMYFFQYGFDRLSLNARKFLICGKEYTLIKIGGRKKGRFVSAIFDNLEESINYIKTLDSNLPSYIINSHYGFNITRLFDKCFTDKQIQELHIKYNSPILAIYEEDGHLSNNIIEIDAKLDGFGFAKIIDPYTMFQEIEMYLANVLCNCENGNVQISDKDLVKQKGFTDVSFRKLPTPKGVKKRPKEL